MDQDRRRSKVSRAVVMVLATLTALAGLQITGEAAGAHQPEHDPATEEGTTTGAFRPGLTEAGLASVEGLDDARLWLSVQQMRDRGARFDVRVELLNDGVPVAEGLRRCVGNLPGPLPSHARGRARGFPTAKEVSVPWSSFEPVTLDAGDVLSLRVSTRAGTRENGSRCGGRPNSSGLRVHYDAAAQPSGFGLTITPDPSVPVYLHSDAQGCDGADLALSEDVPIEGDARCQDSGPVSYAGGNTWSDVGTWDLPEQCDCANELEPWVREHPPAPEPEEVVLERLPVPPLPTDGVCDLGANPQGCVAGINRVGGFLGLDAITAGVTFAGAPGSPFEGSQIIAVKVDGSTFDNGTPWQCLTCGMPEENRNGLNVSASDLEPFNDGRRILLGDVILECEAEFTSTACTPEDTFLYPIRWNTAPDGEGPGGSMRELRIHPDDVHLGWNSLATGGKKLDQFTYYGRLEFNPAPTTGEPAVPRYDLVNVNLMYDSDRAGPIWPDPENADELVLDPGAQEVGEFRRFSPDGQWAAYVGFPSRSNWIDMYDINLETGEVRQLTRHPEYTDPMGYSYDGEWTVMLDTRTGGGGKDNADRQRFMSALPGIPPLTDLISTSFVSSVRNDGQQRFFQPILLDIHGDRGDYEGQPLKEGSCPEGPQPGNLCDQEWSARADPQFSPDGTSIVYRELNHGVGAPDAETGRGSRIVIARLVEREPKEYTPPEPAPDVIPWATPYEPGDPEPFRSSLLPPEGEYTLQGTEHGHADVRIVHDTSGSRPPVVSEVEVSYHDFSVDGVNVIDGTERVIRLPESSLTTPVLEWHSNLTLSGCQEGTKITYGPDGEEGGPLRAAIDLFRTVLYSEGDLVSTLDGESFGIHPYGPNHRDFAEF